VLRSVRPFDDDAVATRTRRARYRAGRVDGRDVPAYVQEDGVTPAHGAGTFAEVTLELESWRWWGTGSCCARQGDGKRSQGGGRALPLRAAPALRRLVRAALQQAAFGLEPETLTLELTAPRPGVAESLVPLTLSAETTVERDSRCSRHNSRQSAEKRRKGGDSNPRDGGCPPAGFQDQCIQPLCHPSERRTTKASRSASRRGGVSLRDWQAGRCCTLIC
jgi:hypothetical protein